jgi:hypothetical protein
MSKSTTFKRICMNCLYYKEIKSSIDIFPNDKNKCIKFKNSDTYQTIMMARYDKNLCGSYGKYYTPKYR